jgi:hypothetical protein
MDQKGLAEPFHLVARPTWQTDVRWPIAFVIGGFTPLPAKKKSCPIRFRRLLV